MKRILIGYGFQNPSQVERAITRLSTFVMRWRIVNVGDALNAFTLDRDGFLEFRTTENNLAVSVCIAANAVSKYVFDTGSVTRRRFKAMKLMNSGAVNWVRWDGKNWWVR